jgi:hypothetical protein
MIYGQGLYASSKPWDGTITIEESIPETPISNYIGTSLIPLAGTINAGIDESVAGGIAQQVPEMGITNISMTLAATYDYVSPSETVLQFTLDGSDEHMGTYDQEYVRVQYNDEDVLEYVLETIGTYESGVAQSIDDGSLIVATVETFGLWIIKEVKDVG